MALDYERLCGMRTETRTFAYDFRATLLYNVLVGMGSDPLNEAEKPFFFERGLRAVPSLATTITWDSTLLEEAGIDMVGVVHGAQKMEFYRPLPPGGRVSAYAQLSEIYDKGADKGAIILMDTHISDADDEAPICSLRSTVFARRDGGFGGPRGPSPQSEPLPDRAPERIVDCPTRPDHALLYRLCGDLNPLHADPDFARAAGFPRPILHGLCTYGIACRAVLKTCCEYDPARLSQFEARFSAPVYPGETIRTEIWQEGATVRFLCRKAEDGHIVLDQGQATIQI